MLLLPFISNKICLAAATIVEFVSLSTMPCKNVAKFD